jgi:hypothetical protein
MENQNEHIEMDWILFAIGFVSGCYLGAVLVAFLVI